MAERRRGCGCTTIAATLIVLLLVGAYAYTQLPSLLAPPAPAGLPPVLGEQGGQQAATAIAGLPSGSLTITDAEVNGYIAANPDALKPLDSAQISFTPGRVTAELRAIGTTSSASTGLAVADGRIVAVEPTISGPLRALVNANQIADALTAQINDQLVQQGRIAREVRVEQGQITISIE